MCGSMRRRILHAPCSVSTFALYIRCRLCVFPPRACYVSVFFIVSVVVLFLALSAVCVVVVGLFLAFLLRLIRRTRMFGRIRWGFTLLFVLV